MFFNVGLPQGNLSIWHGTPENMMFKRCLCCFWLTPFFWSSMFFQTRHWMYLIGLYSFCMRLCQVRFLWGQISRVQTGEFDYLRGTPRLGQSNGGELKPQHFQQQFSCLGIFIANLSYEGLQMVLCPWVAGACMLIWHGSHDFWEKLRIYPNFRFRT